MKQPNPVTTLKPISARRLFPGPAAFWGDVVAFLYLQRAAVAIKLLHVSYSEVSVTTRMRVLATLMRWSLDMRTAGSSGHSDVLAETVLPAEGDDSCAHVCFSSHLFRHLPTFCMLYTFRRHAPHISMYVFSATRLAWMYPDSCTQRDVAPFLL